MADRAEKVIRSTDHDALSCRFNAISKGYLPDEYTSNILHGFERVLKYEHKLSHRRVFNAIVKSNKLPIINRGTYIRTRCLNFVIEEFLKKFGECDKVRVLSLGAGSDTRPFKYLKSDGRLEYVEFDFGQSVKLKHAVIATDEELSGIVGTQYIAEDTEEWFNQLEASLITERYKLVAIDLRNNDKLIEVLKTMSGDMPTLIISECMLCYTESSTANQIITTLKDHFSTAALAIYDPIGGEGNFGSVMIENLKMKNLSMPSILEYNTLDKYKQRLHDLGIEHVKVDNMYRILNNWIDDAEKLRVSKLEFLDEIEELRLLLEHYCLILGIWGFTWDDLSYKFTI